MNKRLQSTDWIHKSSPAQAPSVSITALMLLISLFCRSSLVNGPYELATRDDTVCHLLFLAD